LKISFQQFQKFVGSIRDLNTSNTKIVRWTRFSDTSLHTVLPPPYLLKPISSFQQVSPTPLTFFLRSLLPPFVLHTQTIVSLIFLS
jgi:hypothetical protein